MFKKTKGFILGFVVCAMLLTSITAFANSNFFKRVDSSDSIGFFETDSGSYVGGVYIDPNTGCVVFASSQERNLEFNSDGDIFLNSEGKVYTGYLRDKNNELITMLQLKSEIQKLQKQIDQLKKK